MVKFEPAVLGGGECFGYVFRRRDYGSFLLLGLDFCKELVELLFDSEGR